MAYRWKLLELGRFDPQPVSSSKLLAAQDALDESGLQWKCNVFYAVTQQQNISYHYLTASKTDREEGAIRMGREPASRCCFYDFLNVAKKR